MKLLLAILIFATDVVAGSSMRCNACIERDGATCTASQRNETCATDKGSLGTTHCGSAAIKYRYFPRDDIKYGLFRGCVDCADEKAACFNIGGYLKAEKWETLLQCKIDCCNDSNCNTQVPSLGLSQPGITVFTPDVSGQKQCQECLEDDAVSCTRDQDTQKCAEDTYSLGTTHCGSAVIKYQDKSGYVKEGVFRGCIDCGDKKAACAAIGGYLKSRKSWTLMECILDCCTGDNCNDGAADQGKCNYCVKANAADCAEDQELQICATDRYSLGTSHCASMVGKYRDYYGKVRQMFYRGCIDCTDKKAACYALGGYFKGDDDDDDKITLQKCEIECCNCSNCNTRVPTLSQDAISVFTPAASGPKQCNACLESDAASCSKKQSIQICATDPNSLGTSHCGSAVGKFRDRKGKVMIAFIRRCINCADKKAACAAIKGFLKRFSKVTLLECEIKCCTGDNCNTQFPTLPKGLPAKPTATLSTKCVTSSGWSAKPTAPFFTMTGSFKGGSANKKSAAASQEDHRSLFIGVLAFVTTYADILYLS